MTNFLDRAILFVSPRRGAERIATRQLFDASVKRAEQITARALESSEKNRTREAKWLGSRLSVDAFLEEDLEDTRHRSRELYRNDFVGGAIDSRVEHVVGNGFTVRPKIKKKKGVITEAQADDYNEQLADIFEQVEPTACRTRKRSLWSKTCLVQRGIDADGEAFVVFSDIGTSELPIPLCVEVIDPDRVETPRRKQLTLCVAWGFNTARTSRSRVIGSGERTRTMTKNSATCMTIDRLPGSVISSLNGRRVSRAACLG